MRIVTLHFNKAIIWRTGSIDPFTYELPEHPGVRFVNPLAAHVSVNPHRSLTGLTATETIFETDVVAFSVDECAPERVKILVDDRLTPVYERPTYFINIAIPLLASLRYFSKQPDIAMSEDCILAWSLGILAPPLPVFAPQPGAFPREQPRFRNVANHLVGTAVSSSHIQTACACPHDFRPPVFDGLLLDAIRAHSSHDYRTSILYAAMAMESAVSTTLTERYEQDVKLSDGPRWRTIGVQQPGGVVVRKDPIWEALSEKSSFGSLMHESALYILGRSLLVECESLFQESKRLYKTRNKIAHEGKVPIGSEQHISLDADGSARALDCAVRVVAWLGVKEAYVLPMPGFQEWQTLCRKY